MDQPSDTGFVGLVIIVALYLIPTLIAFRRNIQGRWGVTIINVLFGWTAFGWVVALIWAVSAASISRLSRTSRVLGA